MSRSRTAVAATALVFLGAGCAPIPDLTFIDPDASPNDATVSDANAEGGQPDVTDASFPETSLDGASSVDAADAPSDASAVDAADAPSDAGALDSADALACLPAKAPPEAGCCYAVLPCVGLGCDHCAECIAQACHTNQFCCAQLNAQGTYQGVQCSGNGKGCP
jgi:hypothetical protein